jgi:hypothetical protein
MRSSIICIVIRIINSRRMIWKGYLVQMRDTRKAYKILVVKLEGRRPRGRSKRRWESNIKTDLREMGLEAAD